MTKLRFSFFTESESKSNPKAISEKKERERKEGREGGRKEGRKGEKEGGKEGGRPKINNELHFLTLLGSKKTKYNKYS